VWIRPTAIPSHHIPSRTGLSAPILAIRSTTRAVMGIRFSQPAAANPFKSLDRLADVELQSVMHCLDVATLMTFSRCSRRLFRLLSHSFTWRYAPPFDLVIDHTHGRRYDYLFDSRRVCSPSLAYRPMHVSWANEALMEPATLLQRLPSIHSLDVLRVRINDEAWVRLMALPVVQQTVRSLRIEIGAAGCAMIAQLKQLQTLQLHQGRRDGAHLLTCLVDCPTLTALTYAHGDDAVDAAPQLKQIARCARLKELTIIHDR
jgi:hypothetical protein